MAIELSGSDASGLKFIADYPDSKHVHEVFAHLTSPQAKNVAFGILGKTDGLSEDELKASMIIRNWAKRKYDAEIQKKNGRILELRRNIRDLESELRFLEGKK